MTEKFCEITIAGTGTGSEDLLTLEVLEAIKNSEYIIAHSNRMNLLEKYSFNKKISEYKDLNTLEEIFSQVNEKFLLLVSGEPGLYSVMPFVKKFFPNAKITVLPGISSMQVLCARFCEEWHDAIIISGHGREINPVKLLNTIERNRLVVFFCDKKNSPDKICQKLSDLKNILVMIGENLSLENERLFSGSPNDFITKNFDSNALLLIKNLEPYEFPEKNLRNNDFVRDDKIKITNESIRTIILDELGITNNSIFWDIGAGTGSISISIALENPEANIHAIDYKSQSVKIIRENINKFHIHNVKIYEGRAKDVIKILPVPTHVFIGGNSGELREILKYIEGLGSGIKVLVETVTLESMRTGIDILRNRFKWEKFYVKQVMISESNESLDEGFTLMSSCRPVMLLKANVI